MGIPLRLLGLLVEPQITLGHGFDSQDVDNNPQECRVWLEAAKYRHFHLLTERVCECPLRCYAGVIDTAKFHFITSTLQHDKGSLRGLTLIATLTFLVGRSGK